MAESGLVSNKNGYGSGSGANTPPDLQGQGANGNKYLPSSRLVVNAHKGKQKKKAIDITEMIGSSEDIARRIEEQLDRPKAMFADEGRVSTSLAYAGVWKRAATRYRICVRDYAELTW